MAGLRELKKHLSSVQMTGQMAGAMKTASTAKFARLNRSLTKFSAYADACAALRARRVCLVNVMSSPGSGKTTLLVALIRRLAQKYRVGVMEADIDSDVDAVTVARETGCRAVQLHTGGMCHLDAGMTGEGLRALGGGLDLIFLENVGNLVCPAEYDTGATMNLVLLSVPEGVSIDDLV